MDDPRHYVQWGRFTDPGEQGRMLETLPDDFDELCEAVRQQIVHYRMLSQWEIARSEWEQLAAGGTYLFSVADMLEALEETAPGVLSPDRPVMSRLKGSCSNESIFLTSALRSKGIPARVRMGYFSHLYQGEDTLQFWMNVNRYERDGQNPEGMKAFVQRAIANDNLIEHWISEYWDEATRRWRLLDVRTEYPEAYGIPVTKHLPDEYFEYAWQAWLKIKQPTFNAEQYGGDAWDGDGRSHIRRQLLLDFYSLLNREAADVALERDAESQEQIDRAFHRKSYTDLSEEELQELDQLAELMSREPTVDELLAFYRRSKTLKLPTLEEDPRSFVTARPPTGS
jgi:excinuclease ABC subunit A